MQRPRHDKAPDRCDPADPTPVASYTGKVAELSIDERVRALVRQMVPQEPGAPEPTLQELAMLEAMDGDQELVTPHQLAAMEVEQPRTDLDGFLAKLSAEEMNELRQLVTIAEETQAPPDGAPGPGGPDNGAGPSSTG